MGLLAKLEKRQSEFWSGLANPQPWLWDTLGAARTSAGVAIGPRTALESTPALRAIRLIGESLSSVPLNLMEQTAERQKRILREHPTHRLLHNEPNEMMSSAMLRQVIQLHSLTFGNGYIYVERNAATGRPAALLPLVPDQTRAVIDKSRYFVETYANGQRIELSPADVIHIPWLSWDGLHGESPVRIGKRTLGLGIAAEEASAKFFGQGMLQSGVIEQAAGTNLKQDALDNLKTAVEAKFGGLANAWRPMLLQPGMTWKSASIEPDKAQAKELRELNVADVARIYGVPLHLLASLSTGAQSYASVEQFGLIFVRHTMLPWYFLWEQELDRKLIDKSERARQFTKFNLDALLRGDKKSRAEGFEIELRNSALTTNEWRDLEDRDPFAIPEADEPLIMASQMAPLSQIGKQPLQPAAAPANPARDAAKELLGHEARRCVRQLADSVARIAAKYKAEPAKYATEMRDIIQRIADDYVKVFDRQDFDWFAGQCADPATAMVAVEFWRKYGPAVLTRIN
jgi:HK97 family phage portal protein